MSEVTESPDFDILDGSIEDLADLQTYDPWPEGTYETLFDWSTGKVNEASVVRFDFKLTSVLELANPEAEPPKDGSIAQISAFLINKDGTKSENGQGMVKLVAQALQETFGGTTPREVLDAAKGGKVAVTFKVRSKTKDGETNHYQKLVALVPAD
jgi:hypothetical protein